MNRMNSAVSGGRSSFPVTALSFLPSLRAAHRPDAAENPPRTERHGNDVAGRKDERLGNAVCIG